MAQDGVECTQRLLDCFYQIRSSRVCACALWIIAEYSTELATIEASLDVLKTSLGPLPFYTREQEVERSATVTPEKGSANPPATRTNRPAVLADGTYATQVLFNTKLRTNIPKFLYVNSFKANRSKWICLAFDFC